MPPCSNQWGVDCALAGRVVHGRGRYDIVVFRTSQSTTESLETCKTVMRCLTLGESKFQTVDGAGSNARLRLNTPSLTA